MILIANALIFTGILSSIGLASYKLYYYNENRKIEIEYEKIMEHYINGTEGLLIDFPMQVSNDFDPFRVIHFESVCDVTE